MDGKAGIGVPSINTANFMDGNRRYRIKKFAAKKKMPTFAAPRKKEVSA